MPCELSTPKTYLTSKQLARHTKQEIMLRETGLTKEVDVVGTGEHEGVGAGQGGEDVADVV
jgi:hypothetical protein